MSAAQLESDRQGDGGLDVSGLTVRFGGLLAVDDVSLAVSPGERVGLLGPNGAGKTTIFNACTGLNRPSAGRILLFGQDVSQRPPVARARAGLGRTFQLMELYDRLSVRENVSLGKEARLSGNRIDGAVLSRRTERREVEAATERALDLCGIGHLEARRAGALSTGQRRLVELARAVAAEFRILLLDEPSSGLDPRETRAFGEVLRNIVDDQGVGILLVEHDMSLVKAVCDRAFVLDFGRLIEQGPVDEVLRSDVVRAAYLGQEAV